ncbi:MAG: hypothetical protein AAGA64_18525, partial [Bacteroidota bacterium]
LETFKKMLAHGIYFDNRAMIIPQKYTSGFTLNIQVIPYNQICDHQKLSFLGSCHCAYSEPGRFGAYPKMSYLLLLLIVCSITKDERFL